MRLLKLVGLGDGWVMTFFKYVLPEKYEIRRYSQEFYLANTFKYIGIGTLIILLHYPVEWFLWVCDGGIIDVASCAIQFEQLDHNRLGIVKIFEWLYLVLFGENNYAIWQLYNSIYVSIAIVQLYVISRLVYQYVNGLFKVKSKIDA
jgi:hypothetical protein